MIAAEASAISSGREASPLRAAWIIGAAALAYGGFIYMALPPTVIAINDDFGYLRSVIETMAHGRPWTNDWLEPWSASLSVLAALLFTLTGSFHAATSGAQALFAAAAVAGAATLLRARGLRASESAALAILAVSCPTVLWKSLEFTGVALYLPCLLWAIWAAERRRWTLFFLIWLVAIASRQSALSWLALPAWSMVSAFIDRSAASGPCQRPAGVILAGAGAFIALSAVMNKTQSQAMITDRLWQHFSPVSALTNAVTGIAVALVFAGLGAAAVSIRRQGFLRVDRPVFRATATLSVAALFAALLARSAGVIFEHESFLGTSGYRYAGLLVALSMAAWLVVRFSFNWGLVLAAAGSLALLGLRPAVWDYYFIDVAVLAFFSSVLSSPVAAAPARFPWPRAAWTAACLVVAVLHAGFAVELKGALDRRYASIVLAERALRRGQIGPEDLAFAPFGFMAWHLHPYFVANDGRRDENIANFQRYLRPGAVELKPGPVFRGNEPGWSSAVDRDDDPNMLISAVFGVGWFWKQRFSLISHPYAPPGTDLLKIDRTRYVAVPFPLSDAEWRAAIRAGGK